MDAKRALELYITLFGLFLSKLNVAATAGDRNCVCLAHLMAPSDPCRSRTVVQKQYHALVVCVRVDKLHCGSLAVVLSGVEH